MKNNKIYRHRKHNRLYFPRTLELLFFSLRRSKNKIYYQFISGNSGTFLPVNK